MNRVESIEFAKKLQDQFADLEKTEKDIKHYEEALEKPLRTCKYEPSVQGAGESALKAIMIVFSILLFFVVAFYILLMAVVKDFASGGKGTYQGIALFVIVLLAVGIIIMNLVIKARREEKEKRYIQEQQTKDETYALKKREDMQKELDALERKRDYLATQLSAYNDLIPEKYRSRYYMSKVRMMLQSEKAKSVDEAIEILVQSADQK